MAEEHAGGATRAVLRTLTTRDLPFVTNSWLKSNRKRGYRHLHPRLYAYWHHRVLEALIPPPSVGIVACDADTPDKIYGYAVARNDAPTLLVHYVYVRESARGWGIARALIRELLERFAPQTLAWTHSTEHWEGFVAHLRTTGELTLPGFHNPYLAFLQWAEHELEQGRR